VLKNIILFNTFGSGGCFFIKINLWMDGYIIWMDGWIWMDGYGDGSMDGSMDGWWIWMDQWIWMNVWIDG
jgi:hypothetical protein